MVWLAGLMPLQADTLRLATWNVDLHRKGPGLLLRDIRRGEDAQILGVTGILAALRPDIVLLQGIDHDHDLLALQALRDRIAAAGGAFYPYLFAPAPNSGQATGLDMDGDGRRGGPRDAQGYGDFAGQGGMALMSQYPISPEGAQDFSALLWRDLPGALLPQHPDGRPFPSAAAQAAQRLSQTGHWVIPVQLPGRMLHLLAFHATPPVFDGPEDANGRRNHDEIRFWQLYLDGVFGPAPDAGFVLIGDANLDPSDSDGRRAAIRSLLADPRLQDPRPMRPGPVAATPGKSGDPRLHTVDWPAPGPGGLRVSYILPSRDLSATAAAVHWPPEGTQDGDLAAQASRHRLVWLDLAIGPR